ncbi:hypothetical protein P9079_09885 [Gallibacterium anatis]|uniref:Uncharacterized protein n=1 Tax=Gallibacterium anatis 4895 TaxID=1396510 RepID=A0A0A3A2B6_9PAST|nr:hypothetical protein [Gallibacterium anatis]KGQ61872.1 hypothetical protein IO48_06535 [Gallibacterium anatis 4895]WIM83967.1 hypothetical protein QP020_09355 [Gallibacterium anatis]
MDNFYYCNNTGAYPWQIIEYLYGKRNEICSRYSLIENSNRGLIRDSNIIVKRGVKININKECTLFKDTINIMDNTLCISIINPISESYIQIIEEDLNILLSGDFSKKINLFGRNIEIYKTIIPLYRHKIINIDPVTNFYSKKLYNLSPFIKFYNIKDILYIINPINGVKFVISKKLFNILSKKTFSMINYDQKIIEKLYSKGFINEIGEKYD